MKEMTTSGAIDLTGMEFHACHGCLEKERIEGNTFTVDFHAELDLEAAAASDDLADTIDYGRIYDIAASEMAVPSNLLEHVAGRILQAVSAEFPQIRIATVSVAKHNPPVDGPCLLSKVTLTRTNESAKP